MAPRADWIRQITILGLVVAFVGGALATAVVGSTNSATTRVSGPFTGTESLLHATTNATSHNWAGYSIKTSSGAVTDVKASWNVPGIAATCPSAARYSSFWVGIDGDGSSTVEQTGTESDCSSGSPSYYAWYEFYPAGTVVLSMTIHPADHMHGEVKYNTTSKKFTVTLKDLTTGKSFSTSKSASTATRSSAEWIAEAPFGSSILPLANFGSVTFTNASATISGHTHSISGFSNNAITMWNSANTKVKASVGALQSSGTKFKVTWKSAGP